MAEWAIERLNKSHDRKSFTCGNEALDSFLKTLVGQYEKRRLGRTFVATACNERKVVGYYTTAAGAFPHAALPEATRKQLPQHPVPTIHLGRLAVDLSCQGQHLGETLLFHFLRKALDVSEQLGVFAVDLLATDESAGRFYRKYAFVALRDEPLHFHLPMETVAKMFAT